MRVFRVLSTPPPAQQDFCLKCAGNKNYKEFHRVRHWGRFRQGPFGPGVLPQGRVPPIQKLCERLKRSGGPQFTGTGSTMAKDVHLLREEPF